MQTKLTIFSVLGAVMLIGGAVFMSDDSSAVNDKEGGGNAAGNVVFENGVQYIDITARGGYTPRVSKAKAGIPTVIRMETKNSYDCSTALVIPDIKYQKYLKQTGVEEIEIPLEKTEGTLRGMCSMAMYHFQIDFE